MKANAERLLTAIYCDDIRQELGGKRSFMGCYEREMTVRESPLVLPKFCIYATLHTPLGRPLKALTLRVLLDDEEIGRKEAPAEILQSKPDGADSALAWQSFSTALIFSPFIIEGKKILRVVAETEEGEMSSQRLRIKIDPNLIRQLPPQ